jgi:sorbitol-specific phosphotransferase system component IIC
MEEIMINFLPVMIKLLLVMFGVISFWGMFTSETDERRWRLAAYCAIFLVLGICLWPVLR